MEQLCGSAFTTHDHTRKLGEFCIPGNDGDRGDDGDEERVMMVMKMVMRELNGPSTFGISQTTHSLSVARRAGRQIIATPTAHITSMFLVSSQLLQPTHTITLACN